MEYKSGACTWPLVDVFEACVFTMFARLRELLSPGSSKKNETPQPSPASIPVPPTQPAQPTFAAGDFCVDDYRPMKVVVIGAGMSGLAAAIR